ncbi:MAG TPA: hypothetical protein VHO26_10950 [Propionibacteriaceae bacterium]|nr:hypothetical protein [Propionibacteriaceae bacterium]
MSDKIQSPVSDLTGAPLPTERTLKYRRNLAVQSWKFALFNARILRMVLRGRH